MDRLNPLDALFVDAEDEDRHTSMAIASIAMFEGPVPSYEEFRTAIAGRLPLVPRYRQKVRRLPLDLGGPVWTDDPRFDLGYHVRQTALPAPGGDAQLCRLIERVMGQRLDRDRPLWEYWMVDGLDGGRWALICKVHHCMVDGVSGTELYRVLLDSTAEPGPAVEDTWQPAAEPSMFRLTAGAIGELLGNPVRQARALRDLLGQPRQLADRATETGRGLVKLAAALVPVSASSLSGRIGQQRRYHFVRAGLADIGTVRRKLGGTMNDIALSAITGGFAALLTARGEPLGPHSIRTLVPVSVRAPGEESICDNRISLLLAYLPVDIADPEQRLHAVHDHIAGLKASREAEAGETVTTIARYEPFPLVSLGLRLAFRLPHRNIVTVTTNVPGPRQPVYALGRRALELIPYVPIATTLRFGVSIFSYCDQVTFGITGDRASAPDIDVLARGISDSLAELVAAAEASSTRLPVKS